MLLSSIILVAIGGGTAGWFVLRDKQQSPVVYQKDTSPIPIKRVVLITVDTLRADHLGAYGYPRAASPFIDRLARNGIIFQNAFCSMATTTPSHSSIMTSLYPITHRVLKNGHRLDDSFYTLAEIFSAGGFKTAGFVSTNSHFKDGNLNQGFTTFNEPPHKKGVHRRSAEQTIKECIKWLEKLNPVDPFFLWIHLFDLHRPFNPVSEYREMLSFPSGEEKQKYINFLKERHHLDLNYFGGEEKAFDFIETYDSELLFLDHQIQRLYKWMAQNGFGNETIWIITSDHGEGLGNHQRLGHGRYIYNVHIRIPLVFHFTDQMIQQNMAVEQIVEHIDLLPTLLDLSGWSLTNTGLFQGTSFSPLLLHNGKPYDKQYAFSQRRDYSGENKSQQADVIDEGEQYESGEKYSLQDIEYKYIHHTTGEDECYHVKNDPYETENLVNKNLPECARIRKDLLERVAQLKKGSKPASQSVDKKTIEKLRSLGYVQ